MLLLLFLLLLLLLLLLLQLLLPQSDYKGEKKKRENIIELDRFTDKRIRVKFAGGREVTGILKGHDQLLNMVLDDAQEYLRDATDPTRLTDETRTLGLIVCRSSSIVVISPEDGMEEIANPFLAMEA
ncbi:uncharacterized protein MONBRDRAFT_38016 [Monosiga brevicollis MX1]|uniref:Sm domain-containing protein n=1 Tax=Monosiga brevicollis TaxID=81824 RepID=A9V574_MONBE|nr:uncharacterized protein MONBRDRAFT_38016 [Monosiga brevicollis MX1]EDQ87225.1 predicted protein [Monosiga brevicollis MX1]|eukprot:XP_001747838.1 hypothetical protein [Monosiga brevicollis MX1]